MNKLLKEWWNNWAIIDLIGLIIGLGGLILFIFKDGTVDENNWKDIWSNLSAEIVGTWLSVRIINAVLERRSKKSRARLHVVDNLYQFLNTAKQLINWSDPKRKDIDELDILCKRFDQRWEQRAKFFYDSELRKIDRISKLRQPLIDAATRWFECQGEEEKLDNRKKIEDQLAEFETQLVELRDDIWEESHPDEV